MASPLVTAFPKKPLGNNPDRQLIKGNHIEIPVQSDFPFNFGEVVQNVYRSSFPQPWNLPALKKLGLKTIMHVDLFLYIVLSILTINSTFVDEQYSNAHVDFLLETGITHHRILIAANKDPNVFTPESTIVRILELLLDHRNQPILIHCNKGKHRTGCVVGCFRKVQGWPMDNILDEYRRYSHPKSRPLDEEFIMSFDHTKLADLAKSSGVAHWKPPINPRSPIRSNDDRVPDRRHVSL